MEKILRNIRLHSWFWGRLVARYWKIFLSSFVSGLLLMLLSIRIYPALSAITVPEDKVIGVVGSFTPTTLPLSIQNLLSVGLVGVTSSGEPAPALAENWEVHDDGKQYIFHLKDSVVWHDGRQLVADDINYNFRDVTITSIDPHTIEVTLKEPFSPLPILLSKPLFRKGLVGVGPYRVAGIRFREDKITLLNLVPFQPDSDLVPITIKFYPTEETAKLGFILGEVNTLEQIRDPKPFLTWEHVSITENVKYNQYVGLFFNLEDSVMSEKDVRQSLALAIEQFDKNPIKTPLSSKSWAYNPSVKQYDVDVTAAKKLLGRVIDKDEHTEITLSTFHEYLDLAETIATAWEKLETISVKIRVVTGVPSDFQVLLAAQEIPPDPDQYAFWHSTQKQSNITRLNNAKIDKLLEDARKEQDFQKRKDLYAEFQKDIVEQLPTIFLFHPTLYTITRG